MPKSGDIDLQFLARRFKLSGGDIRNICVAAAYLAGCVAKIRYDLVDPVTLNAALEMAGNWVLE